MLKLFSQSLLFVTFSLKYLGFFNFLLKIFFPFYRYNTFSINKVMYMLQSTKIKILGIAGTFAIISTAYTLHASVFYKELYPVLSNKKISLPADEIVKVEKKVELPVENDINDSTIEVKIDDVLENNNSIAVEVEKIEVKEIEQNSTTVPTPAIDYMSELERVLKEDRYLYIDSSSQIIPKSKETLQKLKPLISKLDGIYIEVEGYSAAKASSNIAKKDSEDSALLVSEYLKSLNIDQEIVVTAYGDSYPIVEDTKDIRNSRVEVKIRRR